jgi:hypothetical protein
MITRVAGALWICVVFSASAALAFRWIATDDRNGSAKRVGHVEVLKIPQFSVPIFKGGSLLGYAMIRVSTVATGGENVTSSYLSALVVDEAFRAVYKRNIENVSGPDKADIDELTASIVEAVNKKTGKALLESLLIQEWLFVGKQEARQ